MSVSFNKKEYKSNEQAFQCTKADRHGKPDLALALKDMSNSYEIKIEASNIIVTDEWNKIAPDILWDLLDEKMKERPELLERLIKTAPLRLIEASKSTEWGGGPSNRNCTIPANLREKINSVTWQPAIET